MKTKQEIEAELPNFYGTENYYKWSIFFPRFVMTDGAQYIADTCGAYWLMDAIASYQQSYKREDFVVAKLFKFDHGWKLRLEDGNDKIIVTQNIESSNFPLDEITLYVVRQDDLWVILLPSEY